MRPFVKLIFDRHVAALHGVTAGSTWIDHAAASLSLWLALEELDSHHIGINPATNGSLGRWRKLEEDLLNWLDHVGADGEYCGDPVAAMRKIFDDRNANIIKLAECVDQQAAIIEDLRQQLRQAVAPTVHVNGSSPQLTTPEDVERPNGMLQVANFAPIFPVTPADEFDYPPIPPAQENDIPVPVDNDDFRQRCLAEMRRLATNGTTCSQREWNQLRQDLPDVKEMLAILRMSWNDLVAAAGLRRASGRRVVRATGADLDAHIAAGAELVDDGELYVTKLEACATRTVERQGKLPTGEPVRAISTHYMLR